jgi:hypothetical protein
MNELWNQFMSSISVYAPRVLAALAILVVGWLVALVLSRGLRGLLRKAGLNDRLPSWLVIGEAPDAAAGLAKVFFYLLMLFVLVGVFHALGLTVIIEPLNSLLNELFVFAPKILAAGIILVLALLLATGVKKLLAGVLNAFDLDRRLLNSSGSEESQDQTIALSLAETAYWLIILMFLPAILGALEMRGLLAPVQNMVQTLIGFLPNLLAAAVIFAVGWFVARIVQRVVTGLIAAAGADSLSAKAGLSQSVKVSALVGGLVYALILIPVGVAALSALKLEAVTAPASRMLELILNAIPQIFAAALILAFSFVVGKVVAGLVQGLLAGAGFDRLPAGLGMVPADRVTTAPSRWAATAVLVAIMLFATTEAAAQLGFEQVADLVAQFLAFAGQVGLGLVILVGGLFLANVAGKAVRGTGRPQSGFLAIVARTAVLVLTGAMALREMGFAEDIVNLAFGLLFGAVAVAVALAFGLGGKEFAGKQLQGWRQNIDRKDP